MGLAELSVEGFEAALGFDAGSDFDAEAEDGAVGAFGVLEGELGGLEPADAAVGRPEAFALEEESAAGFEDMLIGFADGFGFIGGCAEVFIAFADGVLGHAAEEGCGEAVDEEELAVGVADAEDAGDGVYEALEEEAALFAGEFELAVLGDVVFDGDVADFFVVEVEDGGDGGAFPVELAVFSAVLEDTFPSFVAV